MAGLGLRAAMIGWSSAGSGFCEGSSACGSLYKFDEMSIGSKQDLLARACSAYPARARGARAGSAAHATLCGRGQELATACGLKWPCKVACEQDYR